MRLRESSGRPWESFRRVWRSSGRALGASLYRQTPDQPPQAAAMLSYMLPYMVPYFEVWKSGRVGQVRYEGGGLNVLKDYLQKDEPLMTCALCV